jgi:hypothetical protein
MVVVAETTADGAKLARPTPGQPAYYIAFDDGYWETGDPVANEKPPTAAAVARALRQTLAAEGYRPATDQKPPSLLLIYHWGSLNKDSLAIPSGVKIDPNLKARLALVAGGKYAHHIEDEVTQLRLARELHTPLRDDLTIRERELLELAQDGRYFVIVSAYDYAALGRHKTRLLWRTKMSANDPGVAMVAALPALIQGGGPYFGRDNEESQFVRTPLEPGDKGESGSAAGPEASDLTGAAGRLDDPFVREIAEKEGVEVTGARSRRASS